MQWLSCAGVPRAARTVSDTEEELWKTGSRTYDVPSKVGGLKLLS